MEEKQKMTAEGFSESFDRGEFNASEMGRAVGIAPTTAGRDIRRILKRMLKLDKMLRAVGWRITIEKEDHPAAG